MTTCPPLYYYDITPVSIQCVGNLFHIPCDFVNTEIDAAVKVGLGR